MKAAMILVLSPSECANLLNEDLSLLVRKDKKLYVAVSNLIKEQGKALIYAYCKKDAKVKLMEEWYPDDNGYGLYFENAYVCDNTKPKKPKAAERGVLTTEEMWENYELQMLEYEIRKEKNLNSKVVCSFWCDNVEEIACEQLDNGVGKDTFFYTESVDDIRKDSCLDTQDLINYLGAKPNGEIVGKAIHIKPSSLKIFEELKELREFYGPFTQKRYERIFGNNAVELDKKYGGLRQPTKSGYEYVYPLTCAPRTGYCYIEVQKED